LIRLALKLDEMPDRELCKPWVLRRILADLRRPVMRPQALLREFRSHLTSV
jgi:hypothetical protein